MDFLKNFSWCKEFETLETYFWRYLWQTLDWTSFESQSRLKKENFQSYCPHFRLLNHQKHFKRTCHDGIYHSWISSPKINQPTKIKVFSTFSPTTRFYLNQLKIIVKCLYAFSKIVNMIILHFSRGMNWKTLNIFFITWFTQ